MVAEVGNIKIAKKNRFFLDPFPKPKNIMNTHCNFHQSYHKVEAQRGVDLVVSLRLY